MKDTGICFLKKCFYLIIVVSKEFSNHKKHACFEHKIIKKQEKN